MRSKKGMGVGQVFMFIIMAITFAVIMIFGYKMIFDFKDRGESVQFAQFKNDLEGSIKKIYTEYGAVRVEEYFLPTKYTQICFVDLDAAPNDLLRDIDPIAWKIWDDAVDFDSVDENVFLRPAAPTTIKVHDLEINAKIPEDALESQETKIKRLMRLNDIQRDISKKKNATEVGKTCKVLVEERSRKNKEEWLGRTDQNKGVVFAGEVKPGDLVDVRIESYGTNTLLGALVGDYRHRFKIHQQVSEMCC